MRGRFLLGLLGCVIFLPLAAPSMAEEHNGGCVGFSGTIGGAKFAGIKCYLDSDPGNYVIRYTAKERDKPDEYRTLLRVPRKPIRCTLVNKGTRRQGGTTVTNLTTIEIKTC